MLGQYQDNAENIAHVSVMGPIVFPTEVAADFDKMCHDSVSASRYRATYFQVTVFLLGLQAKNEPLSEGPPTECNPMHTTAVGCIAIMCKARVTLFSMSS